MPHLGFLGLLVILGVDRGSNFARHALNHLDAAAFQRSDFIRIIRKQPNTGDTQRLQDFSRHGKLTVIRLETKPLVGFDRIQPGVLQFVGLQLGHQSDAPPLLLFIDKDARTLLGDHGKRHLELPATIAAQRTKNISGKALRMNPYQRRRGQHIAHHQRDRALRAPVGTEVSLKPENAKLAPAGREVGRSNLSNRTHNNIITGSIGSLVARRWSWRTTSSQLSAAWSSTRYAAKITSQSGDSTGAIAQLGERIVRNDEVVGSIPTSSTKFSQLHAAVLPAHDRAAWAYCRELTESHRAQP